MSKYFTLKEFAHTDSGIINNVPDHLRKNAERTLSQLDILRNLIGKPVKISSGYRNPELNKRVKGEENSQHIKAEAADIIVESYTPETLFKFIIQNSSKIKFDQLILEPRWVHISFSELPRNQKLIKTETGYKNI